MEKEQNKDLTTFNWDDVPGEFGDISQEEEQKKEEKQESKKEEKQEEEELDITKEKEAEKKEPEEAKEEKQEKEEAPEGVFKDIKGEEEEGEDVSKNLYVNLAKDLKDVGLFAETEIPEDLDAEKFIELQEKEIDSRVEETIKGFMNNLDADAATFLEYKLHGGDTKAFFDTVKNKPTKEEFDESSAESFLRESYKDDSTIDDVDDRIEYLKEKGKLVDIASKRREQELAKIEAQEKALAEKRKEEAKKTQEQNEKLKKEIIEFFDKTEDFDGIKFTKEVREQIAKAITVPDIKVGDNRYLTKAQAYVSQMWENKKALGIFTAWAMSGFNNKIFEASAKNKVIKDTNKKLRRTSSTSAPKTSSSSGSKALWEYFSNE